MHGRSARSYSEMGLNDREREGTINVNFLNSDFKRFCFKDFVFKTEWGFILKILYPPGEYQFEAWVQYCTGARLQLKLVGGLGLVLGNFCYDELSHVNPISICNTVT